MTHTTNPLLSKSTITDAIYKYKKSLINNTNDSLFSVNKVQERFYTDKAIPINHDPNLLLRTQDLQPWLKENSNLYLFTRKSFERTKARIGLDPMIFISKEFESIDIDTQDDWDMGEVIVKYYKQKGLIK